MTEQHSDTWTPARHAHNGPVDLAYDHLVGATDEPLLLVMGLGTSRFWWPLGLCQEFAAQGFEVARHDQRDAGQSTRMPDTSTSNPFAALFGKKGDAYSSEDMTDDAIAVMDALGWERAHIFGHSMGGTIAQRIALRHPDRVLSVVSSAVMPSDASGVGVARYLRFGLLAKLARMKFPEGREGDIEASLAVARGVASPDYPFDDTAATSGSSVRSIADRVTPRPKAARLVPSGTDPSSGTWTSPRSFSTATRTPSGRSQPAGTPPSASPRPDSSYSPVSDMTYPRHSGRPSPPRCARTLTASPPGRSAANPEPSVSRRRRHVRYCLIRTGGRHACAP